MDTETTEVVAWLYVVIWTLIIAAVVIFAGVEVFRYRRRQIAKLKESGQLLDDDHSDAPDV
jgi:hypothetical protein